MATILSKTFDMAHGAVILSVQDAIIGAISSHTIYALKPDGTANNVPAEIATMEANVDAQAQALKDAMTAAGWTGGV